MKRRLRLWSLLLLVWGLVVGLVWSGAGELGAVAAGAGLVVALFWLRRLTRRLRGSREVRYPPNWEEIRQRVFARDKHRCVNCRRTGGPFHAHHIVPLSRGGTNNLTNVVTVCAACHALIHPHMRSPRD